MPSFTQVNMAALGLVVSAAALPQYVPIIPYVPYSGSSQHHQQAMVTSGVTVGNVRSFPPWSSPKVVQKWTDAEKHDWKDVEPAPSEEHQWEDNKPAEPAEHQWEDSEPAEPAEPAEHQREDNKPAEPAEHQWEDNKPAEPAEHQWEDSEPAESEEHHWTDSKPAEHWSDAEKRTWNDVGPAHELEDSEPEEPKEHEWVDNEPAEYEEPEEHQWIDEPVEPEEPEHKWIDNEPVEYEEPEEHQWVDNEPEEPEQHQWSDEPEEPEQPEEYKWTDNKPEEPEKPKEHEWSDNKPAMSDEQCTVDFFSCMGEWANSKSGQEYVDDAGKYKWSDSDMDDELDLPVGVLACLLAAIDCGEEVPESDYDNQEWVGVPKLFNEAGARNTQACTMVLVNGVAKCAEQMSMKAITPMPVMGETIH